MIHKQYRLFSSEYREDLYWIAILFNIFLSDLLPVIDDKDFASYADDNTIYCVGDSTDGIILSWRYSAKKVFKRSHDSQVKGKTDIYHLVLSNNDELNDK